MPSQEPRVLAFAMRPLSYRGFVRRQVASRRRPESGSLESLKQGLESM